MAVSPLHVQVIASFDALLELRQEWQAFEATCATDLPFQTWEWTTSWWTHLREDSAGVRDTLNICVVRQAAGDIVGIAPLMITVRPRGGPLRVRFVQFIGADPNFTEIRSMLCLPGADDDCYAAVLEHLNATATDWDWMAWEGVQEDRGQTGEWQDRMYSVQAKSAFVIDLAPTWEAFKTGLGRNIKQSLRKCYNTLKRDDLTYRLEVIERPDAIEAGLADFFRLHAARAHLEGTVPHPDVFALQTSREFLAEACQRLAARGVARIFQLWVNDALVATRIGFVMGDTLYMYYSGWDPNFAQYSVMTTLLAEVIQYAIANGQKHVHLSTGVDASKTRWGVREVRYVSGRQLSSRRRARTYRFMYERATRFQSSNMARVFTPALSLLVRGPSRPTTPKSEPGSAAVWRLGALVPAAVATIAFDLLDGRVDGVVNLFP